MTDSDGICSRCGKPWGACPCDDDPNGYYQNGPRPGEL